MNAHNLPCPCHVVCETLDDALWLRKYVNDTYSEEDWIDALESNRTDDGFLVSFGSDGEIEYWEGYFVHCTYDHPLIFCGALIEQEDVKSVGEFADVDLENLLTNADFVSTYGRAKSNE